MQVDAIVNTANPWPVIGLGTDSMIHEKSGPDLLRARKNIGIIDIGCAAITPAFNLQAKYVIHTVGPVWDGGNDGEEELLRQCYENSLQLAVEYDCQSIAFPLISTGNYGFPKDKALQIAISAFSKFLLEHEMQIYLVVFNRDAYRLSEKLFSHVASYIDQNYVDACEVATYSVAERIHASRNRYDLDCAKACKESNVLSDMAMPSMATIGTTDLGGKLKNLDIGFSESLLQLIDKTGKKDSEIYKKANISKQHFSKIRNNPHYQPTKATAIAFALALELDVDQTNELISKAGYTLTNSSKFDVIIQYFIQQKNYNIVEINIALYEFDQNLLGA